MIYSVIIVDADSGILILEKQMKILDKRDKISPDVLAGFFRALNNMIDDIQHFMKKGRDVSNMTRTVASEGSTIILHYQPQARILICSISDPDDDEERIKEILKNLGKRFWLKHRGDLNIFRKENIREIFNSFSIDIENFTLNGRVAERFPKLLVGKMALDRIRTMGIIDNTEYKIANLCDGKTSALKIAKELELSKENVFRALHRLEDVDIIKNP
ncbi:MAG: hypothetical protein ACTSRZ_12345 [Promethearchaeota archaeon]